MKQIHAVYHTDLSECWLFLQARRSRKEWFCIGHYFADPLHLNVHVSRYIIKRHIYVHSVIIVDRSGCSPCDPQWPQPLVSDHQPTSSNCNMIDCTSSCICIKTLFGYSTCIDDCIAAKACTTTPSFESDRWASNEAAAIAEPGLRWQLYSSSLSEDENRGSCPHLAMIQSRTMLVCLVQRSNSAWHCPFGDHEVAPAKRPIQQRHAVWYRSTMLQLSLQN